MTANANINAAAWSATKGTFTWPNIKPLVAGINDCVNGDCQLPGETYVAQNGDTSVSVYTIDYTAPSTEYTAGIMDPLMDPLKSLTKQ